MLAACHTHCLNAHGPTADLLAMTHDLASPHEHSARLADYLTNRSPGSLECDRFLHVMHGTESPQTPRFELKQNGELVEANPSRVLWIVASRIYEPWLFDPTHPFVVNATRILSASTSSSSSSRISWIDMDDATSMLRARAPGLCLWMLRPHLYTARALQDGHERVKLMQAIFPDATMRVCPFTTHNHPLTETQRTAGWEAPWVLSGSSSSEEEDATRTFSSWLRGD